MEFVSDFRIIPSDGERPGAFASFPYDRDLVRRFREAFPRARWREEERGWFVPGTTAVKRLDTWIAQELANLDRHADAKGRDAYLFDPLESPYLTVGEDLRIRTPYSHTIVETLRSIPWAHWDRDERIWHVPFRSYEELRLKWPVIEEAARRNEPAERCRRREEQARLGPRPASPAQLERRRRRYPVPGDDLPPVETPLMTLSWGIVVFEEIEDQVIEEKVDAGIYPHAREEPGHYVWAHWRVPTLQEIYRTRPAREAEERALGRSRGWWRPDRDELQERARQLRQIERAQRMRHAAQKDPVGPGR